MSMDLKQIRKGLWDNRKKVGTWIVMFISSVSAGLGIIWSIATIYLDDYVDAKIVQHEIEVEQRHNDQKPLRVLFGEAMGVPPDVIPYHFAMKFAELDSLIFDITKFSDVFLPYLERETTWIIPRLYIDPITGEEWWVGRDGKEYRVGRYEGDQGYIWYHGEWKKIFK